jgi:hypothetical protein
MLGLRRRRLRSLGRGGCRRETRGPCKAHSLSHGELISISRRNACTFFGVDRLARRCHPPALGPTIVRSTEKANRREHESNS